MAGRAIDRSTPSLIEPPELGTARVASVALVQPIDKLYSFRIPDELESGIVPGVRVSAPVGRANRPAIGFCVEVSEQPWDSTLKPVLAALDQRPLLNARLLELGRRMARYYCAPLGRTLHLMVPAAAKRQAGWRKVRYAVLQAGDSAAADPSEGLSAKQSAVIMALRQVGGTLSIDACTEIAGCGPAVIQSLRRRGVVRVETRLEPVAPAGVAAERHEPGFELNADQKAAIELLSAEVAARRFSVQVLFGVTGSGKTECYVAAIRRALAEGRQAILLVPEIALTTQTVQRLAARFDSVAMIHSGLSDVQRSRAWAAIATGDTPVVIGTRSAIFAPCPNIGLIVVDEEAETSYKSQASPRYHTRDAAIMRGQIESVPVVMGSATPSLETWLNLQRRKHYKLIRLPRRVRGLPMPTMHLVDMREEHRERIGVHLLSREMETRLAETLRRGEQAVLLLNRRGFASFLHCSKCRAPVICPRCSVHMVFHATTELAHCHYCQARLPIPTRCQMACCDGRLVKFGIGIQRAEEELRVKFPAARIRRIDSDTMERASDYAEILGAFERKEFDVLLGTQMIAKGLDFPFVSFVGAVSADTALALSDFRSEERTFQLVLQVAGRSGRGELPGQVVVQTFAVDTAPIRHAVQGDYEGFADAELRNRKHHGLPPYTRLMRIVLADGRMSKLKREADAMVERIRDSLARRSIRCALVGPAPAPIARLRDKYRLDVQLRFPTAQALLAAVDLFKSESSLKARVKSVTVDVDPVSLQ